MVQNTSLGSGNSSLVWWKLFESGCKVQGRIFFLSSLDELLEQFLLPNPNRSWRKLHFFCSKIESRWRFANFLSRKRINRIFFLFFSKDRNLSDFCPKYCHLRFRILISRLVLSWSFGFYPCGMQGCQIAPILRSLCSQGGPWCIGAKRSTAQLAPKNLATLAIFAQKSKQLAVEDCKNVH